MWLAVDTVNSVYNFEERRMLSEKFFELEEEYKAKEAALDKIEDDDAWEKLFEEIHTGKDSITERKRRQWIRCFAAQFPKTKNEWFANVINDFEPEKEHQITAKQFEAFHRYARKDDNESWRTGKSYCRCGDYLVTLKWKNACRTIKIEYISEN